jgi:hypothetical protein
MVKEEENNWYHFVVLDNRQKDFDEFLEKQEILYLDHLYCSNQHRHYIAEISGDLKEEEVCKKKLTVECMKLFCKQSPFSYQNNNYLVE